MTFAEKLDLLMKITNTSNVALARSIALDASFISRLRRGKRTPATNVTYFQAMAEYFARNCQAEYQKSALLEAIRNSSPHLEVKLESYISLDHIIYKWLNQKDVPDPINSFLNGIIHFQFKKADSSTMVEIDPVSPPASSEVEVFYGITGKQKAVLRFLSLVIKSKDPQTLLLYSDEGMDWLTGSRYFAVKWAALLSQFLKNGGRIRIIHAINRNFDEMLTGIKQWVPLYMTGAIEPYYCPRSRDGLFRRTMFLAPETPVAVTSSSVGSGTPNAANFLLTNIETLKALTEEFNDFLHLCRPLMRIFTPSNKFLYLSLLAEFEAETSNTIIKSDGFPGFTLPLSALNSIMSRTEIPDGDQWFDYFEKRAAMLLDNIKNHSFSIICTLPEPEQIIAGKAPVNFSDMLGEAQLFYSPDEYHAHLLAIIDLLENYPKFSVYISNDRHLDGVTVYVKADIGVLVAKTSMSAVVFAINEINMTTSFWDYLQVIINKELNHTMDREDTLAKLKKFACKIEEMTRSQNENNVAGIRLNK